MNGGTNGAGSSGGGIAWPRSADPVDVAPNGATLQNGHTTESQVDQLRAKLSIERSVAEGAANLLKVFETEPGGPSKGELKAQVETELETASNNIRELEARLEGLETPVLPESSRPTTPSPPRVRPPAAPQESFETTFDGVVTLFQRLGELEQAAEKIKTMDAVVAAVLRQSRIKFELVLEDVIPSIVTGLADEAGGPVRSATYRLLRHLIVDAHDVSILHSHNLPLFLIRSLARGDKHELEKEQALRLIRTLLDLPEAPFAVPSSVIRAVVALAEAAEEKLKLASLETLGELLLRDLPLLVSGEGLRVVLQSLSDGPHDFSPFLASPFLWVMDRPGTRQYLRPGLDVEVVLAGFTETHGKGSSHEERVRSSAKIVTTFLKSWSGLMGLCLNGRQALASLVNSLQTPSHMIRDTLLDIFFHVFNLKRPSWDKGPERIPVRPASDKPAINLIDQYLAIVLLLFIEAGLLETLASVASESHDASTTKQISLLLGELLRLSTRILPLSRAMRVHALPKLFSLTTSFDASDARLAASSTLSAVDAFNRDKDRLQLHLAAEELQTRANSADDPLKRGQRQVESAKIRMGMQIEDAQFRNLLLETQVLATKDYTRWSLPILTELLEGPLLNPRRLDEAMRASKFMRRLLSFFHPFNYRYTEILKTKESTRYTQLACLTLTTLLANPDGVRYLTEDKLLPQIADALVQLDPLGAPAQSDIVLSKYRMEKTLASGYFEMLGTLSKSADGVRLMEQFKIFTSFYRISELRSRDDLIKAIICNIDYTFDGHPRVLLSKALTSSYKHVRVFATEHLAKLTRESETVSEWQIRLLLTQLYDPSPDVCELAVHVLEEVCQSLETLEIVVQMRPTLDHLGDMGVLLLTRFLSTSVGTRYLYEIDFIERELDDWYHERNYAYMIQIELLLASVFQVGNSLDGSLRPFDGTPPPHFYGELVKTPEGCDILTDSGHFPHFADFIQQHGLEDSDSDVIARLKSVLWAVGHVGASEGGLPFLEQEYIIQSIVEIAEDSPVFSLRGTAYFVLGLISSTAGGAEMLEDYGWECVCTPLGGPTGVCVPVDVVRFVETPPWDPIAAEIPVTLQLAPPANHLEREALAAFANLSNHILATKASKLLAKLKSRHRELFSSPSLYCRALEMISSYHYRQPVRRYIIELFDIALDDSMAREIVKAGEELKTQGLVNDGEEKMTWTLPNTTEAILVDGLDSAWSDDEDESPEEGEMIPLEVLKPMLTVRGFFIS